MFGEVLRFDTPLLWAIGFVFLGGGIILDVIRIMLWLISLCLLMGMVFVIFAGL